MTVYIFASLTPKAEHVADVEAALRVMVAETRKEPGNQRYDLMRRADGAPGFHLFESYRDAAAVQAHRDSAHYTAYRAKVGTWLAEAPDVKELVGVDVVVG
ncbi:quinol monooxygenase YgiN [Paraburkholderia caballeronis]|uniref:putative quinol monooxygenase n=1 Tax=Paraburkholderia caballeronis TaxID=416943 RepID=UPI001065C897|nr:putative quinol monooxygenase [Paraburkholderia caballeronis]TDV34173.1 quinol monooxygenase YgiN [Paraburkholderia caballeronis]